jgi:PilZ domain-containing protein
MSRFTRVATDDIEARLGSAVGHMVNVSATGALLRMNAPFLVGRSCPLFINLPASPVSLNVQVVRTERLTTADTAADVEQLVGVRFTEFSSSAKHALAKLCGTAFTRHD